LRIVTLLLSSFIGISGIQQRSDAEEEEQRNGCVIIPGHIGVQCWRECLVCEVECASESGADGGHDG
jgi:hypothetical protein